MQSFILAQTFRRFLQFHNILILVQYKHWIRNLSVELSSMKSVSVTSGKCLFFQQIFNTTVVRIVNILTWYSISKIGSLFFSDIYPEHKLASRIVTLSKIKYDASLEVYTLFFSTFSTSGGGGEEARDSNQYFYLFRSLCKS